MTMIQQGRPEHGALTRRVWEIADDLLARSGVVPRGREVVDAYMHEDPRRNEGTAFTQYSHWKKAQEAGNRPRPDAAVAAAPDAPPAPEDVLRIEVAADGTMRLPAGVLGGLGLPQGGVLSGRFENGQLTLVEPLVALRRVQEALMPVATRMRAEGRSVVDELIAERRAESAREGRTGT